MGKRDNPDYSRVAGLIPKNLARILRVYCADKGIQISAVLENAVRDYLQKEGAMELVGQPKAETQIIKTVAEIVRQNFWTLREHNIKNIDAIAQGQAPTKADIMRISSILDLDQGELLKLAKDQFGSLPKPKTKEQEPNGCNSTY